MNQPVTPKRFLSALIAAALLTGACQNLKAQNQTENSQVAVQDSTRGGSQPIAKPLVSDIYTADPSAHVFNGRIYIYPSHDIEAGIPSNDNGDHFGMRDYHILSLTTSAAR